MAQSIVAAVQSWVHFFVFTVLPVALSEVLRWIYEWQVLVGAIIALVAARLWSRSLIRAAEIAARSARHPPQGEPRRVERLEAPARPPMLRNRLFALREMIRVTLGKLPCTDEPLSPENLADCRRVAEFALGECPAGAPKSVIQRYESLRSKLQALKGVRQSDSCRHAWQALAGISLDARDLTDLEKAA